MSSFERGVSFQPLLKIAEAQGAWRDNGFRNRAIYEGRDLLVFVIMLPGASLLLSGSRGGLISLFAEILFLGTILLTRTPTRRHRPVAAATGLGVAAAILFFFWMAPDEIPKRLMCTAKDTPVVDMHYRLVMARDSLRIFRDHPWVGAGCPRTPGHRSRAGPVRPCRNAPIEPAE